MPEWLSDTVSLGTQKGKSNPSTQAIKKWEDDLNYMKRELSKIID